MASGSGDEWDAQKILDLYIHDYMVKKNMHKTAEIFAKETNICQNPVVIDTPEGFLNEWWSIFWDVYSPGLQNHPEAKAESSVKATEMMENEPQNISPAVPTPDINQRRAGQFPAGTDFDKLLGQPAASLMAAKMFEEERLKILPRDLDANLRLLDVDKWAITKPSSNNASYQQLPTSKRAQPQVPREDGHGIHLGGSVPMDSTLHGVPKGINSRTGLPDAGKVKGKGVNLMPSKGWPITGVGPFSGMEPPILNSFAQVPNQHQQFQASAPYHQHDLISQVMKHTPQKPIYSFPGINRNSSNLMLPKSFLSGQDGRTMVPVRQTAEKQMTVPMRKTAAQQQKDLRHQQLHENTRTRKSLSNSLAGKSALDGSDNELNKSLDENVESFLSHDDNTADVMSNSFSTLQRSSSACDRNEQKGFSFEEVGCVRASQSKVLCCHFSSQGNFLASSGHEKKVLIWNMETFNFVNTAEGHSHIITDVRFKPNSAVFATSSFDKTVQIWDASKPTKSPFKLIGHAEQVMSLDFHPKKPDILCSCDGNDEVRLWSVNKCVCTCIFKGASKQVRFQPRLGNLLAAASGNTINLIDVETNSCQYQLKGHVNDVRSICWDTSGKYIASVSEESARVWSTISVGKCIHELHSNGNKFESCTFHPGYSQLLIIGSYQSLELWNPTESNKTMTVDAHKGIIAALADSPQTEMIASASHDHSVKLWK